MLKPLDKQRWDYKAAAHLLNRAGFGGTPVEIEKLRALGLDAAVDSLVLFDNIPDTTAKPEWAKPDPERFQRIAQLRMADAETRRMKQQEEQRMDRERMLELKHWWLQRMATGPRPFQEKMTLFWHGHFATSMEKVRDPYLMWKQNDIFRELGTGNWLTLLIAVSQDPAMLVWLDQALSRPEHPNENFAREVMELFTLGEGHYTEKDVTEAARAFTGWTYDRPNEQFVNRPRLHDTGQKTVLGRTGDLHGEDVLRQIVAQPQSAKYITARLWNFFAGELPSPELNAALAEAFRDTGNNFGRFMGVMFRSEEFYSDAIVRGQVKSPVQWLVGSVKVLERDLPPQQVCINLTRNLGQDLFAPPNVKGWDGGISWINTNNLLSRYNEAAMLVQGNPGGMRGEEAAMMMRPNANRGVPPGGFARGGLPLGGNRMRPIDVTKILSPEQRADKDKLIAALEQRLLQGKLKEKQEKSLREYLDSQPRLTNEVILNTIRLMMSTPEYQLT